MAKGTREPETPRVVELLRKAMERRRQIDDGEVRNQAAMARREGITRAGVTQVMGIPRLAPEIQEQILSIPDVVLRSPISGRILRHIEIMTDYRDQLREFHRFLG